MRARERGTVNSRGARTPLGDVGRVATPAHTEDGVAGRAAACV